MKVPGAAWSDEQIIDVLQRVAADEPKAAIARSYGITARSIRHLLGGARASRLAHEYSVGLHERAESPTVGPFPCFPDMRPAHNAEQHSPGLGTRDTIPSAAPNYTGVIQGGAERPDPRKDPKLHVPVAPNGFHLRGVSTLVDAEGKPIQTWIKTSQDREQDKLDALWQAVQSLPEPFRAAHKPFAAPRDTDSDLLCVYPIADAHYGMYSWAEETGADYDVRIAEELHTRAIDALVARAPNAEHALIADLGDLLHCDTNLARTAKAGNPLDTDTRLQKVARVAVRTLRYAIEAALRKHKSVRFLSCRGNHNPVGAFMLAMVVEAFYEHDQRVTVDTSPSAYHWHRFGKCLFGFTHGDGPKPEKLGAIMATKRAADWGASKCRRWYTGHVHHRRELALEGCTVWTLGTLAPADAWADGEGYISERDARVDVYHREVGERGHQMVNAAELAA